MSVRTFADSNVPVCAHDSDAGAGSRRAVECLEDLCASRCGLVSTQVLPEFYENMTQKVPTLSRDAAHEVVRDYALWVESLRAL